QLLSAATHGLEQLVAIRACLRFFNGILHRLVYHRCVGGLGFTVIAPVTPANDGSHRQYNGNDGVGTVFTPPAAQCLDLFFVCVVRHFILLLQIGLPTSRPTPLVQLPVVHHHHATA